MPRIQRGSEEEVQSMLQGSRAQGFRGFRERPRACVPPGPQAAAVARTTVGLPKVHLVERGGEAPVRGVREQASHGESQVPKPRKQRSRGGRGRRRSRSTGRPDSRRREAGHESFRVRRSHRRCRRCRRRRHDPSRPSLAARGRSPRGHSTRRVRHQSRLRDRGQRRSSPNGAFV